MLANTNKVKLHAAIDITTLPIISAITRDYLTGKKILQPYYRCLPELTSIPELIEAKKNFQYRDALVASLSKQYAQVNHPEQKSVIDNIELLSKSTTYTITCGHQLNILTGPLYFIYKIGSVISACRQLKQAYPGYDFVPVYWMASEDHDIAEINHVHIKNNTYNWNTAHTGAAGLASVDGIEKIIEEIKIDFPEIGNSQIWNEALLSAHTQATNLAQATRMLVNALFSKYGLVIVDGMDVTLKKIFIPFFKKEITNYSYQAVTKTNELLHEYELQVSPREINLFYLGNQSRNRIVQEGDVYKILNSNKQFNKTELIEEIENYPERFSPNVVLRPLYQECILPNLAYIGGPGEVAYWLQLKRVFDNANIPFPMLLLRDSFVLMSQKQLQAILDESVAIKDLLHDANTAINSWVDNHQKGHIQLDHERKMILQFFEEIKLKAATLDKTLEASVNGELQKTLKSIDTIEDKMRRAIKRQYETSISKIRKAHEAIFPMNTLQERYENFSWYYAMQGSSLIDELILHCNPFEKKLKIMEY